MPGAVDRLVRELRPPKPAVDPWKAHGSVLDHERRPDGRVEQALTIFLAGAECPFTCAFCDLWRYTIDGPTPRGALPQQISDTLAALDGPVADRVKLYNASNFFDKRAVPLEDLPRIAELCAPFSGVTVESHASTVSPMVRAFADRIPGQLEVAMGLETIHPEAMARLNKRLELRRFDEAAEFLKHNGMALRVFVLLGAPHVPTEQSVDWAVRSARYAAERGADVVSIIPVRGGNGEMERLSQIGVFTAPTLAQLEAALDECMGWDNTVVTADLWDAERLPACESCRAARVERLRRTNLTGLAQRPIRCQTCGR